MMKEKQTERKKEGEITEQYEIKCGLLTDVFTPPTNALADD